MTSTDELTTSLSLRCEEMLAASPSTSNVIRKDYRRRSDRHPFQQTTNNIPKRLSHCPVQSRKRTSDDSRLNSAIHSSVRSQPDRALQRDGRVLANLKHSEVNRRATATYMMAVQTEVKAEHREEIVQWLIEVSQSNHCDADVLPLAVSIMDRFLSLRPIPLCQLQLVGGVCLFIASKLKAPAPLNANTIVYYSDNAFSYEEVLPMEMLILQALEWDVTAPTAFDFFDQILGRMPHLRALQPSFVELVYGILKNYKLAMHLPSVQCALALLAAARRHEELYYRMAVCPMLPDTLGVDLNLMLGLLPQVERNLGTEEPKLSGIAAPPCSNRTPSPTLQALKAPLMSTPINNDSGFNSGASSPESACKKEPMECTPLKVLRT